MLGGLAVAALAARSYRPFGAGGDGGSGGRAPSSTFVDSMFTLALILLVALALLAIFVRIGAIRSGTARRRQSSLRVLIVYLAVIALVVAAGRHALLRMERLKAPADAAEAAFPKRPGGAPAAVGKPSRTPEIVWPLVIGVAVLVGGTVAVLVVVSRRRRARTTAGVPESLDVLADALDDAIDDLRREPDPRRAVVAAYARMEHALSVFGVPRRPAEAPYEYLARAGRAIDAEESVAALTDLFEVAKFSEHTIDEPMRARAIDALSAVRDEVRAAT